MGKHKRSKSRSRDRKSRKHKKNDDATERRSSRHEERRAAHVHSRHRRPSPSHSHVSRSHNRNSHIYDSRSRSYSSSSSSARSDPGRSAERRGKVMRRNQRRRRSLDSSTRVTNEYTNGRAQRVLNGSTSDLHSSIGVPLNTAPDVSPPPGSQWDDDAISLHDRSIVTSVKESDNDASNVFDELPETVRKVLGVDLNSSKNGSYELHEAIKSVWIKNLLQGLSNESRDQLLERHKIPKNCSILSPPKINPEINPILSQPYTKRDECHTNYQNLASKGASALGKCLTYVLDEIKKNPESPLSSILLPDLVDAGNFFTEIFHEATSTRRSYISQILSKTVKEAVKDTVPGEYLFGPDLGEKIKALKNFEKSGNEMREFAFSNNKSTASGIKRGGGQSMRQPNRFQHSAGYQRSQSFPNTRKPENRVRPSHVTRRDMRSKRGQPSARRDYRPKFQ
ncbi:uncharacterized protein LOC126735771 [Anthonomus grandis grandis]|uniref:uncharacterized protein LOC126735771 n=1 Tax=Anthonomus grandis grandis TaxID=2921223 RepID=UPI002165997E|nr:uncharacterized protein LOC126735771 [Anthonomus grandis grandis]